MTSALRELLRRISKTNGPAGRRPWMALAGVTCGVLGAVAQSANSQESASVDPVVEAKGRVTEAYDRYLAEGGVRLQIDDSDRIAMLESRRQSARASETMNAKNVSDSVTATARCADGYVLEGRHSTSVADITIVDEQRIDCDAEGCKAFQVTAERNTAGPFDLDVAVTCSG